MSIILRKDALKPPLTGLELRKAQALAAAEAAKNGLTAIAPRPEEMLHRIGIIFDDSGSMSREQIADAHAGIEGFLRSCVPKETAVSVWPLNAPEYNLSANLPALALLVKSISATGSTPLVQRLRNMLLTETLTRTIVFSDGQPNSFHSYDYDAIIEQAIPVDTVFITEPVNNYRPYGDEASDTRAEMFLRKLAADTGGIYLKFDRNKSNFAESFKYLSPALRYMLADKSFVDKIEGK